MHQKRVHSVHSSLIHNRQKVEITQKLSPDEGRGRSVPAGGFLWAAKRSDTPTPAADEPWRQVKAVTQGHPLREFLSMRDYHGDRKQISGCQQLGKGPWGWPIVSGGLYGRWWKSSEIRSWRWLRDLVTIPKTEWIVNFKRVSFTVHELYFNKTDR